MDRAQLDSGIIELGEPVLMAGAKENGVPQGRLERLRDPAKCPIQSLPQSSESLQYLYACIWFHAVLIIQYISLVLPED